MVLLKFNTHCCDVLLANVLKVKELEGGMESRKGCKHKTSKTVTGTKKKYLVSYA